jgi:hypothetical protein
MDLLALILACSLHPDDALVRTLIDVQSEGNVYFVGDLKTLKSKDGFKSADAALQYAEELRAQGGRPAVGLLGIPLDWASRYGRAPIELFDACTNIAVGTAAFAEYHERCSPHRLREARPRDAGRRRRARGTFVRTADRACILTLFARDLGVTGKPAAILSRISPERTPAHAQTAVAPSARSSIFGESATDGAPDAATRTSFPLFLNPPAKSTEPR